MVPWTQSRLIFQFCSNCYSFSIERDCETETDRDKVNGLFWLLETRETELQCYKNEMCKVPFKLTQSQILFTHFHYMWVEPSSSPWQLTQSSFHTHLTILLLLFNSTLVVCCVTVCMGLAKGWCRSHGWADRWEMQKSNRVKKTKHHPHCCNEI